MWVAVRRVMAKIMAPAVVAEPAAQDSAPMSDADRLTAEAEQLAAERREESRREIEEACSQTGYWFPDDLPPRRWRK